MNSTAHEIQNNDNKRSLLPISIQEHSIFVVAAFNLYGNQNYFYNELNEFKKCQLNLIKFQIQRLPLT